METNSTLRQRFKKHIGKIPLTFVLPLVALVALAVAVMVSERVACCLQELLGVDEKYDVLQTIGFCVAGVLLVWQAWAANKRAKAMEATANEQANATKNQAKATENIEEGQRQERLKNAIEHLGHGSDSVRMGGAYELFHLAKDTEKLRQTVLDILCAHIRQTTGEDKYKEKHGKKPSEEIQSLLTLLFVQKHNVFEDCSVNLQGSYLNGATLNQARLKKAYLRRAQLQRADLRSAQLQGANLVEARLQRAELMKARLQGAILVEARLQRAILREAQLQGADLSVAQLQMAVLMETQLQGAILWGTRLQIATLFKAQLQGAILWDVQLQEVSLKETHLQGISSSGHEALLLLSTGFESGIRDRVEKDSDLTGITFTGGLKEEDLNALCEELSAEEAQTLRKVLRPHIGKPASHKLPTNSGAEIGTYTQEEAERWIAEYQEAMRGVPKRDDG